MKRLIALGVAAVLAAGGAVGFVLWAAPAPTSMLVAPLMDSALVERGAYLARLGDCVACHTSEGGKDMAGGLAFDTPMGRIYSTNITPDPTTGTGRYTLADFEGALRRGVNAKGENLYPAMPYPSFTKISDQDVKALYAYFMKGVAPVEQANEPNEMRFPFNIRLGLSFWKAAFFDDRRFAEDPSKDAQWNRGAYIVEGLGHCGACHTPRGIGMQEVTTTADIKSYLSGSTIGRWRAVSLRNLWSEQEIAEFLKTGANAHAAAYGNMTQVVHDSTQHFSNDDLAAVGHFLKSLEAREAASGVATGAGGIPASLYTTRGGLGYDQFCSACHRRDGRGAPGVFPPLAGNDSVVSDDPTSVIHIALTGWTEAATRFSTHAFSMPEFSSLTDAELAEILTFVRASWGNKGGAVTAADVKQWRDALSPASTAPAKFTVARFADMLAGPNADELILGMRIVTETKATLPEHVGAALACANCHLNGGTVANASPFNGLATVFPTYSARAGHVISLEERLNECFLRSMNGTRVAEESKDMKALVAYVAWMKGDRGADGKIVGRGTGEVDEKLIPDPARGKKLFETKCAVCHGSDGQGGKAADGSWLFPPLWGDASFNTGAGMAETSNAAAFIKSNMPIAGKTKFPIGQGGLLDQDAADIADYFAHQPRPDFAAKTNDWPKGERPKDGGC
jgi:thiosulfate dehydrogenase